MNALKDSLSAIDNMFEDLFLEHGQSDQLPKDVLEQLERAQRMVATARTLASRKPANDTQVQLESLELDALVKRLSSPEKHMIRHLADRKSVSTVLLGYGANRLIELGLVIKTGLQACLSDKGSKLNLLMR